MRNLSRDPGWPEDRVINGIPKAKNGTKLSIVMSFSWLLSIYYLSEDNCFIKTDIIGKYKKIGISPLFPIDSNKFSVIKDGEENILVWVTLNHETVRIQVSSSIGIVPIPEIVNFKEISNLDKETTVYELLNQEQKSIYSPIKILFLLNGLQ